MHWLRKVLMPLRGTNFCTSSACFASSFVRQQNSPECTQIVRNAQKREFRINGVDQLHSLRKIPTRLRGTNFCTSSSRFVPSFARQPNGSECTQVERNAPKCQFRDKWSVRCEKFRFDFVARTFALVRPVFHRVFKAT